jgi:hypothetical protein
MTRRLRPGEPPRGPWKLTTRREINAFFAWRLQVLRALLEAEGSAPQLSLDDERRAA